MENLKNGIKPPQLFVKRNLLMKKNLLLTVFIFLFIGVGCTSKKDSNNSTQILIAKEDIKYPYNIDLPDKVQGDLTTSSIASEVKFIPLETIKMSLIGKGERIRINDSLIVISDWKKIFLFKKDGRFIRQIGTNGKGPGEYLMIFDFELKEDTILLTSTGKRSIIKYTLDGKFQEEIQVGNQLTHFSLTPNGHVVWYNQKKGELTFYDHTMMPDNVIRPGNLDILPDRYSIYDTFDTYFQVSGNKLLFSNYFNDTVWNVSNGEQKAAYVFNLKDKLLPHEVLIKSYHDQDFNKFTKLAANYQKVNLLEGKNKLFIFQKTWAGNDLNAIYTHTFDTGITQRYTAPYIYDDMLSGMELRIKSENQCSEKFLISLVSPLKLLEELEKTDTEDKPEAYDSWKKQMRKVKYDDNPVIAIIKLK